MRLQIKEFLRSYGKFFALAFAIGLIAPSVFGANLKADVVNVYSLAEDSDEALLIYHLTANRMVNDRLKMLLESDMPNVEYVPGVEDCDETNVSTYCIALALNEELTLLEKALVDFKKGMPQYGDSKTLEDALKVVTTQQLNIDEEIENARDTLDLTLSVYNQIQIVYPLHRELVVFMANLIDYRDNLASVRNLVELYPGKFNDATTIECK